MKEASLLLAVDLSYDSIPTPQKFALPIENGKFGIFKYQQHPTDPLCVENITFEHAGDNQIKIKMRGTGQLKVDNFPDIRIGGTTIEVKAGVILKNRELCISNLKIARLDFPNILNFADKLLTNLFNITLLKNLPEKLCFDFSIFMETAREKINSPIPINFEKNNVNYDYNIFLDCNPQAPVLNVTPEGISFSIKIIFTPTIR